MRSDRKTIGTIALALVPVIVVSAGKDVQAQAPHGVVEVRLEPEGDLALKQRCELVVRFLTDGFAFVKAPEFPTIRVRGAVVIPPTSGMNFSERRGGDTWVGIERRYGLYPTRPGETEVPVLTVKASVRNSAGVTDVEATSEPVVRQAIAPEVLAPYPDAVVTSKLTLSQRYEPDVNELKVGDALKRTLTVTADGTVSMLLPVLSTAEIDGLATYPAQPVLSDREYRGRLTATRTDSATYIAQQEGLRELPEIVVHWWEPGTQQVQEAKAPGMSLNVVANPLYATDPNDPSNVDEAKSGPGADRKDRRNPTATVVLILVMSGFALVLWWLHRRYGQALRGRWTSLRRRRAESEKLYFARFRQACAADDPGQAHRALLKWVERATPERPVATLDAFVQETDDPELTRTVTDLNTRLFGNREIQSPWRGEPLLDHVNSARKKWLRQAAGRTRGRKGLPPLNPAC